MEDMRGGPLHAVLEGFQDELIKLRADLEPWRFTL